MNTSAAQEWAIFVSEYTEDVASAFAKAMLLLDNLRPDEDPPAVLEERLVALRMPLPPCLETPPFGAMVKQKMEETCRLLLVAQSTPAPLRPATMETMAVPSRERAPLKTSNAREPTVQQLVNALDAMAASRSRSYEEASNFLSNSLAVNTATSLILSADDSPVKFIIVVCGSGKNREIYVAFPGSECWADVKSDVAFHSQPTATGRYHHGFFDRASKFPLACLAEKVLAGASLFLVGHSLGGAVAEVVMIELLAKYANLPRDRVCCITAGAPMVGDSGVRRRCEQLRIADNLFHMVEPGDAVPRLLSFVGIVKNIANERSEGLRDAVQQIAHQCCRLASVENPDVASTVSIATGKAVSTMAKLFTRLVLCTFEPVGKYWRLPDEAGDHSCRWQPASECNLEAPSSFDEFMTLLEESHHHELARYRQTVMGAFSVNLSSRQRKSAVVPGGPEWRAHVNHCSISVSNNRMACDITGEGLSLVSEIRVGQLCFSLDAGSIVSSTRVGVEIDCPASQQQLFAPEAKVTAVSMGAHCSFSATLPVTVSDMSLREHEDNVAKLDVSELLERLFRMYLFHPAGQRGVGVDGVDPLEYVEALVGCQPIETLYRFLAGSELRATQTMFVILGRLPEGVEALAKLGISLSCVESLRASLRHRCDQVDLRKVATELGTATRFVGAGAAVVKTGSLAKQMSQNAANIAAATAQLASANENAAATAAALRAASVASAAADGKLAAAQHAARHDPGTFARWFHKSARSSHVAWKNARNGMDTTVQHAVDAASRLAASGNAAQGAAVNVASAAETAEQLSRAQTLLNNSAQVLSKGLSYGMLAITVATTAWEARCFYLATQFTKEGNCFADVYRELIAAEGGPRGTSWDAFDQDMIVGIKAADVLVSLIDRERGSLPAFSSEKVLAELFPNRDGIVLDLKETLLKQRQELHARQALLRDNVRLGQHESDVLNREVENDCAKMTDVHTYWIDFITAALSGRTDVSLSRNGVASTLWLSKLCVLDNLMQPWVPIVKGIVDRRAVCDEALKKTHEATSYIMDACSFEARVNLFLEGIVGAAEEHIFESKKLYSKLYAIRKHVPHGVSWRTSPIDISSRWDTFMAQPGIVPGSTLSAITTGSRFEVACWLISCLCVVELYDIVMVTSAVALLGVTSTGKSSLARSIAVNPAYVVAGGLSQHRTSIPSMYVCRPFRDGDAPFSCLDLPGFTDKENTVEGEDGERMQKPHLPGEAYMHMTSLCSAFVIVIPHRLSYVECLRTQLRCLFQNTGRRAESGTIKVLITKCEDVIEEALALESPAAATQAMQKELQDEVARIEEPRLVTTANTHYAVILNPRRYLSEDLQRLGVWEQKDIHQWMSDHCNR